MARLRVASLLVAVVAGDYAALMLIRGQLIVFCVAAPGQLCPLCGLGRQTPSESPRFVDRQGAR
jgi:hypothetical protein